MILLGFISSRVLVAQRETVAKLLIYIIAPIVFFGGAFSVEINSANLSLPFFFFIICSGIAYLFYGIGGLIYKKDNSKNILAYAAGSGNTGYFGLPVVLILFGEESFGLAVLCIFGFALFENTVGFYLTAKGNHSATESLQKIAKLPSIYALFLGLICNALDFESGEVLNTFINNGKGAYSLFGMMMIGMGLSTITVKHIDYKFISLTFLAKFLIWPFIILLLILIDKSHFHWYEQTIYNMMILMSIVPLAANTVVYATELKVQPEKIALAVLLSTIFALFYIPLMASWFIIT